MIPEGPFKTGCQDGVERTFHRSGIHSKDGFVYSGSTRVYGTVTEVYTAEKGYHFTFAARGKHAWLTQPAPSAETLASV